MTSENFLKCVQSTTMAGVANVWGTNTTIKQNLLMFYILITTYASLVFGYVLTTYFHGAKHTMKFSFLREHAVPEALKHKCFIWFSPKFCH
jgi:hypothetical protein